MNQKTKMLKLTRAQISFLYEWLDIPLHGDESRTRNQFIKVIEPIFQDKINNHKSILDEYCVKGEDGKPVFEDRKYKIVEGKEEECKNKINEYLEGSVEINADKKLLKTIYNILKTKLQQGFTIATGKVHDDVLSEFEKVI